MPLQLATGHPNHLHISISKKKKKNAYGSSSLTRDQKVKKGLRQAAGGGQGKHEKSRD